MTERPPPERSVPPGFLSQALRIAAKDLRIEWRSREILYTMAFLAVVVVLIFSFAFVVEGARPPAPVVAGILWVAVVVSGTVALSRAFDREREGEAIRSLLLAPAPRGAIYVGKLAATVCLMLVTETVLTGLCVVLFATRMDLLLIRVVVLLALGTVGFAAAGCVFSAALLRARGPEALFPPDKVRALYQEAAAAIADQVMILRRGRIALNESRPGGFPADALRGLYREATGG